MHAQLYRPKAIRKTGVPIAPKRAEALGYHTFASFVAGLIDKGRDLWYVGIGRWRCHIVHNERHIPYTSPGWLWLFFQEKEKRPSIILDRSLAERVGAKGPNAVQFARVVRTLGIVDAEGRATDRGRQIALGGQPYRNALRDALREVYPELVEELETLEPSKALTTANIAQRLGELSGATLGKSAREQAARIFLFLAREAAEEKWTSRLRARRSRGRPPTKLEPALRPPTSGRVRGRPAAPPKRSASSPPAAACVLEQVVAEGIVRIEMPGHLSKAEAEQVQRRFQFMLDVACEEPNLSEPGHGGGQAK